MGDGNGMGQFVPSVVRRVHLTGTHGHQAYDGKLLLGEITDSVVGALEMYERQGMRRGDTKNQPVRWGRQSRVNAEDRWRVEIWQQVVPNAPGTNVDARFECLQ